MPVSASPFHDLSDLEGMTATQYPPMIFRVSGSYTCLTSLNGCISSSPLLRGTRCCCARDTKRAPLPLSYVPEVCEDCKSTPPDEDQPRNRSSRNGTVKRISL